MLANSLYVETEAVNSSPETNINLDSEADAKNNSDNLPEELVELDLDSTDPDVIARRGSRTTTDLVRLYLQEIGRVPLLERDEEVSEAQKVQRHINILEQRAKAADAGDTVLQEFVKLVDVIRSPGNSTESSSFYEKMVYGSGYGNSPLERKISGRQTSLGRSYWL